MIANSLLTVIPYLIMSFIKSSSMVVRKVSLGWSIRGTTNSRILATLQMTMKSFWFCEFKKSTGEDVQLERTSGGNFCAVFLANH